MSIVDDLAGEELRTRGLQQLLRGTACQARGHDEGGMTNQCEQMQTANATYH